MGELGRIIETDACVAEGADWLRRADPRFAPALDACGPLPLRRRPDGFAQLLSAIVSQQVSVASAAAIWARLQAAGMVTPEAIRAVDESALRDLGLSRQKAAYAGALAAAEIDFAALRGRDVVVLGAGASAMDNAATALEAGAARVDALCLARVAPEADGPIFSAQQNEGSE